MTVQQAQHEIDLWLGIIAGDGLTDEDLFVAAVALRMAARAKKEAEREEQVCHSYQTTY